MIFNGKISKVWLTSSCFALAGLSNLPVLASYPDLPIHEHHSIEAHQPVKQVLFQESISPPSALQTNIYQQIETSVEQLRNQLNIAGMSLVIIKDNTPQVLRGFGYEDIEQQKPVTTETGFRIGSVTKTFTALSIMKLVEQGKLSLDDSIYKHLPDYQPKVREGINPDIRVRDLLTHHSGIPSYWLPDNIDPKGDLTEWRNTPQKLSRDHLTWDRKTVHAYSNTPYSLAGLIVERVSGLSWPEFLQQAFFTPLNMQNAMSYLPVSRQGVAKGYAGSQNIPLSGLTDIPAGSIIASANDMSRYMQALIDSWRYDSYAVLPQYRLQSMAERQNADVILDSNNMGLGFFNHTIQGHQVIEHGGNLIAFHSHMLLAPEQGLGVFISTNDAAGQQLVYKLGFDILKILLAAEEPASAQQQDTMEALSLSTLPVERVKSQPLFTAESISQSLTPTIGVNPFNSHVFNSFTKQLKNKAVPNQPATIISVEKNSEKRAINQKEGKYAHSLNNLKPGFYTGVGLWKIIAGLDGRLFAEFGQQVYELAAVAEHTYAILGFEDIVLKSAADHPALAVEYQGIDAGLLYPVVHTPPSADFTQFIGDYQINSEHMSPISFAIKYDAKASLLYLTADNGDNRMPLEIVDKNLLQLQGRGSFKGMVFELVQPDILYGIGAEFKRIKP